MTETSILTEIRGHVGLLTVNRPEVHNALSSAVLLGLEAALSALEADPAVRVIVVTGAGDRAFVAGGDIVEMAERGAIAHYETFGEVVHRVFRRFETCDKPTIAAVNGYALGGGTELLLALDLRILSDRAVLALPEIGLGVFPGAGGSQRLIRQIAPCVARELMFTGDRIGPEEAVRFGLANRVVPHDDLLVEALALADRIAQKSPLVLKLLKRTLRDGTEMPLAAALAHEQAMIGLVFDSADAHEGMAAFIGKRPASFVGR